MAKLSDIIEAFIKQMFNENDMEAIEIQRNELATHFNCVPSQINYVIDTRFSPDQGYFVESHRGGGGCIRICKIKFEEQDGSYLMHTLATIGDSISQHQAEIFIRNFLDYEVIDERESRIIEAAVSDKVLGSLDQMARDRIRALMLKNIISSMMI
ncbi:MAG: CtsR family transcriptional regulator [Clostridiales bacterium]|nr:CtsR family transcriptional regulator [Clostridiales bacterium]